ncbi:hypothetical protein C8R44DRAFT_893179 [Mycena epipterygia]|nr:hypothetical protein C8R44DRAFT_893179 [Mycena epipterygia]
MLIRRCRARRDVARAAATARVHLWVHGSCTGVIAQWRWQRKRGPRPARAAHIAQAAGRRRPSSARHRAHARHLALGGVVHVLVVGRAGVALREGEQKLSAPPRLVAKGAAATRGGEVVGPGVKQAALV